MESNDAAQQSIENLRATIIELDKLIAESPDDKEISELKELRDKLSKIVESFEGIKQLRKKLTALMEGLPDR